MHQEKSMMEIFIYNVTCIRKYSGISKKEAAKALGVSIPTLNKMERGEVPPRLKDSAILNFSNYFNIPLNYLVKEFLN